MPRMIILSNGQPHRIGQPFTPDIEVIARALAHINRFTGHGGTYSVAQHCVLMAGQVPAHLAFAALRHDAPEAYIGDVSAPLKAHLPEYRKLEDFYHGVIDRHYGVDTRSAGIKTADLRMLITEARMLGMPLEFFPVAEPYDIFPTPWPAEIARLRFLHHFDLLNGRY